MSDQTKRPGASPNDAPVVPTLPARWQSKNMIDGYLRHQWPPKTHSDVRPSGLDCLIVVMRNIVSYLPQERRDLTLHLAEHGDNLAKSFWTLVWLDYDKAGSGLTDVLRHQFLDEYSKNKTARNSNPKFQALLDSDEAFMSDFWAQPEMLTLAYSMFRDENHVWHQLTERRLRLAWKGDITLQEFVNRIASVRADESHEMFTVFGAPEILPIRYIAKGHDVPDLYDQIRGFNVKLYDFNDEGRYVEQDETSYRLIAVVKLRGTANEHDAVRLYRPNGVLIGSCTETDYYPASWTVSDLESYSLLYARFELPDMYNFVRYPELPVNALNVRDFTLANPQRGESRDQPTTTSAPAAKAAKSAGTTRTATKLKAPRSKMPLRKPLTSGKPSQGSGTSGKPSQGSGTSSNQSQETSGKPSQGTSGKPSQETSSNQSQGTSGKPSQETSGKPSQGTSGKPSQGTSGKPSQETSGKPSQGTSPSRGRETPRNRETSRIRSTSRNRSRETPRNWGRETPSQTMKAGQSAAPSSDLGPHATEHFERPASHNHPHTAEHSNGPEPGSSHDASVLDEADNRFIHPDRMNNIVKGKGN